MNDYLPERLAAPGFAYDKALLARAIRDRLILSAPALFCDETHALHVRLGPYDGVISREDAALGIAGRRTRDIAILSCVGRPVCFHVLEKNADGTYRLSRVSAQQEALNHILQQAPGTIVPAVVTGLAPFGAFADIGCGVPALLPLKNICISRLSHPGALLHEGQKIYAALQTLDPVRRRVSISMKELLGTWQENAARFCPGQTVHGLVRSIQDYGAFIALTPNLCGLAKPDPRLCEGCAVSVYIRSIEPETLRIRLSVISVLDEAPPMPALCFSKTSGRLTIWQYGNHAYAKCLTIF